MKTDLVERVGEAVMCLWVVAIMVTAFRPLV